MCTKPMMYIEVHLANITAQRFCVQNLVGVLVFDCCTAPMRYVKLLYTTCEVY